MEEEDSSDLSDDSCEESEQRPVQQIRFSNMPIRNRSGSPIGSLESPLEKQQRYSLFASSRWCGYSPSY